MDTEKLAQIAAGTVGFVTTLSPRGVKRRRPTVILTVSGNGKEIECLELRTADRGEEPLGPVEFSSGRSKNWQLAANEYRASWLPAQCLTERFGWVSSECLERILREKTKTEVRKYYHQVHAPRAAAPFTPGKSRVSYAGRVFDENELLTLTDSTLDFWLTAGRFVESFEKRFAKTLGVRSASLVNSGSSANLVAFMTLTSPKLGDRRIRKGDEVITVAAGFPTTIAPAIQYGAVPVFVDVTVDDGTYNVDCSQLEAALSSRTKAVMIAHTLGNPFNLDAVVEFCRKHQLWLVEDNCDALGSMYRGKPTGTFGDLATSSFYPPHHMTMGEGGAVYTSNLALRTLIESFRDWGRDCWCASGKDDTCGKRFRWKFGTLPEGYDHKYIYSHLGYNLKVTEMQAAIGCAQLDKLESFTSARRSNWRYLRDNLSQLSEFFILPEATEHSDPSWFGFLLSIRPGAPFDRNQLVRHLEAKNIQTRMLFAGNFIRQPCFDEYRENPGSFRMIGDLRNTDRVMSDTFWIGVYPGLRREMLDYMVEQLLSVTKDPKSLISPTARSKSAEKGRSA